MSDQTRTTIAHRVIEKCGGFAKTAELTGRDESVVYRWTYDKSKGGTGGHIPVAAQHKIMAAAARGEVSVKPADFFA